MTGIYETAAKFRRGLLRQERAAQAEMIRAYALVAGRIEREAEQLRVRMEAEGDRARMAWLYERERLETLLRQVQFEMHRLNREVFNPLIVSAQRDAARSGQADTAELIRLGLGEAGAFIDFNRLAPAAVESIVGFTADGSLLKKLLDELPGDAGQRVKNSLIEAVALGWNPRRTARHVKEALGGNLARALTISRTETIRAYREAAHRTYKANEDVLDGWVWTAALDARPCVLCVAMHGTEHSVEERLESHPNCRCTAVPKTKSWAELGFVGIEETRPQIESGEQWFAGQPAEYQQSILGPEAFRAYKAGTVKLADFVGRKNKSEWGRPYHRRSLKEALAIAAQREADILPDTMPKKFTVTYDEGAKEMAEKLLGRKVSDSLLARSIGALDGARVKFRVDTYGRLRGEVEHELIETQERVLFRDRDGTLVIRNLYLKKKSHAPSSLAARIILRQIEAAKKLDVKKLTTTGAGEPGGEESGYYVFARLGFDARLEDRELILLRKRLSSAQTLNDLMLAGEHEWWRRNGFEKEMLFDLDSESSMMKVMKAYVSDLQKRGRL
ncbi:MAG: phage minor head protein [Blastocatellia bacterium]